MTAAYRAWPEPARTMARDIDVAVLSASNRDPDAFEGARAALDRHDPEQLRVLLGATARDLLERTYPDGLDADDAEQVVARCLTYAAAGYPQAHRDGFVTALTGALGVSETDEAVRLDEADVRAHGLLLVAALVSGQSEPLAALLDAALRETMRAQTMELP
jgi:hypothetical protein